MRSDREREIEWIDGRVPNKTLCLPKPSSQHRLIKEEMGITAKKGTDTTDAWGTPDSFLLVFFPDDSDPNPSTRTTPTLKQQPDSTHHSRTRPRHLILSRVQSTISVCALLLSLTLLLFALSSLDHSPSLSPHLRTRGSLPRAPDAVPYSSRSVPFAILWRRRSTELKAVKPGKLPPPFALQGMGELHRRGSHAMPDLVVGHVSEETTEDGLRLFLRALHRSGLTARSDVVLVFPDRSLLSGFGGVIQGEDDAFLRLLDCHLQGNHTTVQGNTSPGGNALNFEAAHFVRKSRKDKEAGEPLWGKRTRSNYSETGAAETDLSARPSYGSVVSFEASELDLEGSLSGFLDHVPMSLRRWSCYSMLLGRLRRNFKHVMLVDVKNWVVLSDPFVGVRDRSSETVVVWAGSNADDGKRHGRGRKEGGAESAHHGLPGVNPGVVVGGMRGVRRMAEAMQIEIVRGAMRMQQRKGRRKGGRATAALAESGVMSQLVGNEFLLKNIELVVSREDDSAATLEFTSHHNKGNNKIKNLMFLAVGNNQAEIRKLIYSSEADLSEIYRDC